MPPRQLVSPAQCGPATLSYVRLSKDRFLRRALLKLLPNAPVLATDEHDHSLAVEAGGGNTLHRVLGRWDLLFLSVASVVGVGVMVLAGVAAHDHAGPAVAISFLLSAAGAALSACCYLEFTTALPVAGGAFVYVAATFGEYAAFVAASFLLLEYTLSCAAVARGFTAYAAALFGAGADAGRVRAGPLELDFPAAALALLTAGLLALGTRESARFNNVASILHLCLLLFIIVAGAPFVEPSNLSSNFAPFGARGIATASALVFFTYVGFDSVSAMAEEARDPSTDLPFAILGSLGIAAALYCGLSLVLTGMVPFASIDVGAPFPSAFSSKVVRGVTAKGTAAFLTAAARIVAGGAVIGICATLLVTMLGEARILVALGREGLLPRWFAGVSKRATPARASMVVGGLTALLALFTSIEALSELVSGGTLIVFWLVAAALLRRRHFVLGGQDPALGGGAGDGGWGAPGGRLARARARLVAACGPAGTVTASLAILTATSVGAAASYVYDPAGRVRWLAVALLVAWCAAVLACAALLPRNPRTPGFSVWSPLIPAAAMFANVFLLLSLPSRALGQCLLVGVLASLYYLLVAVHSAEKAIGEDCLDKVGVPGLSLDSEVGGRRPRDGGPAPAADGKAVEMVGGGAPAADVTRPSETGSDAGLLRLYRLPSDSLATSGGGGGGPGVAGGDDGESPTSKPAGRA